MPRSEVETRQRQQKIVEFVEDFCAERGYSPTLTEVAKGTGMARNTVRHHVTLLVERGRLLEEPEGNRTLRSAF